MEKVGISASRAFLHKARCGIVWAYQRRAFLQGRRCKNSLQKRDWHRSESGEPGVEGGTHHSAIPAAAGLPASGKAVAGIVSVQRWNSWPRMVSPARQRRMSRRAVDSHSRSGPDGLCPHSLREKAHHGEAGNVLGEVHEAARTRQYRGARPPGRRGCFGAWRCFPTAPGPAARDSRRPDTDPGYFQGDCDRRGD